MRIFIWTICGILLVTSGFFFGKTTSYKYLEKPHVVFWELPAKEVMVEVVRTEYRTEIIERHIKVKDFQTGEEFVGLMARLDKSILIYGGDCVSRTRLFVDAARGKGYYTDTEITQGGWHMVLKGFVGEDIWFYDVEQKRAWTAYSKGSGYDDGITQLAAGSEPPKPQKPPKPPKPPKEDK